MLDGSTSNHLTVLTNELGLVLKEYYLKITRLQITHIYAYIYMSVCVLCVYVRVYVSVSKLDLALNNQQEFFAHNPTEYD